MLTYDPTHGEFRRTTGKTAYPYKFHVQFFGTKLTRAWVNENFVVLWKGADGGPQPETPKEKKKKALTGRLKAELQAAIAQATGASKECVHERLITYVGDFKADMSYRASLQNMEYVDYGMLFNCLTLCSDGPNHPDLRALGFLPSVPAVC